MNAPQETPKQAARRLMAGYISKGYEAEALHVYTDIEGNPLHWRIRLKHDTLGKKIFPMRLNADDTYELKEPPYPTNSKPLYNLHQLAKDTDNTVFIVEGEKCADAHNELGLLATTSGSADSVKTSDLQILAEREVVLWHDNDTAGIKWQADLIAALHPLRCNIKCIDVEALNLPSKGDCVDWLTDFELVNGRKATSSDIFNLTMLDGLVQAPASYYLTAGEPVALPDNSNLTTIEPKRTDDEVIAWLATLKPLDYDRVRKEQATALGVRPATLDSMVKQLKADNQQDDSPFADIEPWHEPINPVQLLDDITSTIHRFIVLDKHQAHAATLWVAFTWFTDVVNVAPLAIINAPEKACGKSQLLDLFGRMVAKPLPASNSTAAGLFRAVELWNPTVLIDEADTFVRENDELKGLINAGHTRSNAFVLRVVGDNHEPKLFKVWGAKAFAGITLEKHLPDATMSRAIVINLRKKLRDENVTKLRYAEHNLFNNLASKLARFSDDYIAQVRDARPHLPDALGDRDQDNWEPLLQVASAAGGHWLETATNAALTLSGASHSTQSTSNELLADIQTIFERDKTIKISTAELIKALCEDTEAPWATYNRGKELTARQLATRLAVYGINSKTIRLGYETAKGFEIDQFNDAFTRYLADTLNLPSQGNNSQEANNSVASHVTDIKNVTVTGTKEVTLQVNNGVACDGVTDKTPILGGVTYASIRDDVARF